MNKISINIHVPRAAAVSAGVALYGDTSYEPTSDELGQLSTLEATALLKFEGEDASERLQLAGYAPELWPLIKEALAGVVLGFAERQKRNAEKAGARMHLFEWAINQDLMPALNQAARQHYDVSSRYVFELAKMIAGIDLQLRGVPAPIVTCTEQLEKNASFEQRPSPSLYAMTLETRLRVEVGLLMYKAGDLLVASGTVVLVSPVMRLSPTHDEKQTVVMAKIGHPSTSYGATVIWSAEDDRLLGPAVQELRDPGPEL